MGLPFNAASSLQRGIVILALNKTGLGTPVLSGLCAQFCSVVDNGVGDYTINFPALGNVAMSAVASSVTNDRICRVGVKTISSVQILTEDLAGAAAEGDFDLVLVGTTDRDLI